MNQRELDELPEWLYVFVDPTNPMSVMNLKITGRYTSTVLAALEAPAFHAAYRDGTADFLPFLPNPNVSTQFISPFVKGTMNNYYVEYDAELARRTHFKHAPSRLTGIYAFGSMEDYQAVSAAHGWNVAEVQRFKPQHILRAARVNMEVVSLARHAYNRAMIDPASKDHLWRAYWSGAATYAMDLPSVDATQRDQVTVGARWEWILDGVLVHESRV